MTTIFIVAILLFLIFAISAYITSRRYGDKLGKNVRIMIAIYFIFTVLSCVSMLVAVLTIYGKAIVGVGAIVLSFFLIFAFEGGRDFVKRCFDFGGAAQTMSTIMLVAGILLSIAAVLCLVVCIIA
jgi:hypothetical protein